LTGIKARSATGAHRPRRSWPNPCGEQDVMIRTVGSVDTWLRIATGMGPCERDA
jgi:hypothetical protein